MESNKMDKKSKQNRDAETPQWRKEIGLRISKAREKCEMSQKELSDLLGVNRVTLTYWENGTRDIKTTDIVRLADALGVTCDYLLRGIKTENVNINKELGLSDKSIELLHAMKQHYDYMEQLYPGKRKSIFLAAVNMIFERLAFTRFWDNLALLPEIEFATIDDKWFTEEFCESFPSAAEYLYANGGDVLSAKENSEWRKATYLREVSAYIETALLMDNIPVPQELPKYYEVVNGCEKHYFKKFMKGGPHNADNNETE